MVGGGDSAMEEASFLAKFATNVKLVHRRDEFRASKIMIDYASSKDNVEFVTNAVVEEVLGSDEGKVTGVRLRDTVTGESPRAAGRRPVRGDRARPDDRPVPGHPGHGRRRATW